jgi:Flp pilus assembly pilin Flp
MATQFLKLVCGWRNLLAREEGQNLVEYALVVALLGLGTTLGVRAAATGILQAFQYLISMLGAAT